MIPISHIGAVAASVKQSIGSTDPYWSYVKLLMHCENFNDNSDNALPLTNSNASINSSIFKYGSNSIYFNGSSSYIISNSDADLAISGDYTIEAWIRPESASDFSYILTVERSSNINTRIILCVDSGKILVEIDPEAKYFFSSGSITSNNWYHIAVVKISGVIRLYINGVLNGSVSSSQAMNYSDNRIILGRFNYGSASYYKGYIDELRFTNGIARYTTAFTPPSEQFPDG